MIESGRGKDLHHASAGRRRLPVVRGVSFEVRAGECVVLAGPSGAGKSSILKMIFGNYRCDGGAHPVRHDGCDARHRHGRAAADPARAPRAPSAMSASSCAPCRAFRRSTSSPSRWSRRARRGRRRASGRAPAARLNIPERLWALPPATFSGGEQQRVNIARGFMADLPILLLDEPTASLDAANREVVVDLIARRSGAAWRWSAIVHDDEVRDADRRPRRRRDDASRPRHERRRLKMTADRRPSSAMPGSCSPIGVIEHGWVAVADGRIAEIGEGDAPERGEDVGGDLAHARPHRTAHRPSGNALHAAPEGVLGPGCRGGVL